MEYKGSIETVEGIERQLLETGCVVALPKTSSYLVQWFLGVDQADNLAFKTKMYEVYPNTNARKFIARNDTASLLAFSSYTIKFIYDHRINRGSVKISNSLVNTLSQNMYKCPKDRTIIHRPSVVDCPKCNGGMTVVREALLPRLPLDLLEMELKQRCNGL